MSLKIQRIIFAILTIATFIAIFVFSGQDGDKSSSTSRNFTRKIVDILPISKNLEEYKKEELIEESQYVIRKLAHFTIYTIAGINMMGFINTYDMEKKNKLIVVLIIGVIYAISDEIHQMFSGDRTPAIKDVCIDSFGVLFGSFIVILLDKVFKRKCRY